MTIIVSLTGFDSLDNLLNDTLPELPGADHDFVKRNAIHVLREFCEKTLIYRTMLDPINIVVDVQDYALSSPANTEIVTAYNVRYDTVPVHPKSEDSMDRDSNTWRNGGGNRFYYLSDDCSTLKLTFLPKEAVTNGLLVGIVMRPTLDATVYPSVLSEYIDGIASGIKARLMRMPKKPWSNQDLARNYRQAFNNAVSDARFRVEKSNTRQNLQVKMRPLA